jgi:type IV pilus assembly protein PilN
MARINLLPWRAERRKQRLQEFYGMLGGAAVAAALVCGLIYMFYSAKIDGQNSRNQYLRDQIAIVDKQIEEIAALDKKKERLLRRKEVIEELQSSRSQMVHLFDELARTIADGTRIKGIKQKGQELSLEGSAQSNARVSTYMRNLDSSGWMGQSNLSIIEAKNSDPGLPYNFSLKVTLKNPNEAEGEKTDQAAADAASAAVVETTPAPAAAAPTDAAIAPPATSAPAAAPSTPASEAPAATDKPANSASPAKGGGQ